MAAKDNPIPMNENPTKLVINYNDDASSDMKNLSWLSNFNDFPNWTSLAPENSPRAEIGKENNSSKGGFFKQNDLWNSKNSNSIACSPLGENNTISNKSISQDKKLKVLAIPILINPLKANACKTKYYFNPIKKEAKPNEFRCNICQVACHSQIDLVLHVRTHFTCKKCEKSFSSGKRLADHMETHSEEKPFQCDTCKMCFRILKHLNQHKKIHTEGKLFLCEICGKLFKDMHCLTGHFKIHNGERQFGCEICGKKFWRERDIERHSKVHFKESGKKTHLGVHAGPKSSPCGTFGKLVKDLEKRLVKSLPTSMDSNVGMDIPVITID